MGSVYKRTWKTRGATGHKVKREAWGYDLAICPPLAGPSPGRD